MTRQLNVYIVQNELSVRNSFNAVEKEIEALQLLNAMLETSSAGAFTSVRTRIEAIEEGFRDRGNGRDDGTDMAKKSLIHMKMITPSILSQQEHWKRWKGDIEELCEESAPGR